MLSEKISMMNVLSLLAHDLSLTLMLMQYNLFGVHVHSIQKEEDNFLNLSK